MALAATFAGILEWVMLQRPVPPGGDPGEWVASSYPYVGLPYPTWIIPLQYPPVLFPLLGSLIRLTGSPLTGARVYVGLVAVLFGSSTYLLARTLLRSRVIPLLVEGFVLLNPSFMLLFFFGAYPNLLGFVFMNLSITFLVRFLRSQRPVHLLIFWLAATAAVLTHSLVGVMLGVTVVVLAAIVFLYRRIPQRAYRSWAGIVGPLVFLAGVGGFYVGTRLAKIPHPNYLQRNSFAHAKNGPGHFFYLLTRPILPHVILHRTLALALLAGIVAALVIGLLAFRVLRPQRFSLGAVTIVASILAVTMITLLGWELQIVTDYVRLAYFMIVPLVLGAGFLIDLAVVRRPVPGTQGSSANYLDVVMQRLPRRIRPRPEASRSVGAFAIGVVLLLALAALVSVPAMNRYERASTGVGHDQAFLDAVHYIAHSGIPGSLLTTSGAVKWSRALTARDAYSPYIPGRYSFDPVHNYDGELAYFALTDRYAVTNNEVAVAVSGTNATFLNSSPLYEAALYGSFTPILKMPPTAIVVTLASANGTQRYSVNDSPNITTPPNGRAYLSLAFHESRFVLRIDVSAVPASTEAAIDVNVTAVPGYRVVSLEAFLEPPSNGTAKLHGASRSGAFGWTIPQFGGRLGTTGRVTPSTALIGVYRVAQGGPKISVLLKSANATPVHTMDFTLLLDTPNAANIVTDLPPFLSTTAIWGNWTARFVLYSNLSVPAALLPSLAADAPRYLQGEFGANVVDVSGEWRVLLLPSYPAG